jgi:hypothetical protein
MYANRYDVFSFDTFKALPVNLDYTGGTPCVLYSDYSRIDESPYLYNVSSGSSTTNLFGSYSMKLNPDGTGVFICFYLDSYGKLTSQYTLCTSIC